MTTLVLDPEKVEAIFLDCVLKEGERDPNLIVAEGIVIDHTVAFSPERVENHRDQIEKLLDELPDDFKITGGGMSFLRAGEDKHGHQWTGLQIRMEQLIQLGIAIGKAEYQLPRDVWAVLPGGVPYILVK